MSGLRPSTRTYSQVTRAVRRIFGDEAGVQLDSEDILQWANDAQQEINTKNKIFKAKATTPSVVGQATYTFPDESIQQVESILFDGSPVAPIEMPTAEHEIEAMDPQAEATGCPLVWYEWAGEFTLYPVPDAVKTITLRYTRYPTPLTGEPTQLLDVPDKYYQAVVDYVLWKSYELDEDWNGAQLKEQQFRTALETQAEEERDVAHMTYPVIQDWM